MATSIYSAYQKNNLRISSKNPSVDLSRYALDPEVKTIIEDIISILLSPYAQNLGKTKNRISKKQTQVLVELVKKLNERLDSFGIQMDSSEIQKIVQSKAASLFDEKLVEYLKNRTYVESSSDISRPLNKTQIATMLRNNSAYEDAKSEFVEQLEKTFCGKIVSGIDSGTWKRNAGDEIVDLLSKVISELYEKLKRGIDVTAKTIDELIDKSHNEFYKLVETLKADNKKLERLQNGYNLKNMSLFQAFTTTVIHNSKTYTRNVNLVRDVFKMRVFNSVSAVKNAFLKTKLKIFKIAEGAKTFINTSRLIIRAFTRDIKRIIGRNSRSRITGIFNFVKRFVGLGILGLYGSIRLLSKTVTFAFSAISGVAKFMLTTGFKIIGGVWKTASKLFKGAFSAVKSLVKTVVIGPIKTLKGGISGLFSFIMNNTFAKRLAKFLKSDAGAVFLGTLAAFLKVYVIEPIVEKYFKKKKNEPDQNEEIEDLPSPENPNETMFGDFLNRHNNIARFIIGIRDSWMSIKGVLRGEENPIDVFEKKVEDIFKPFMVFIEPLKWIVKTLWEAGKAACKWRFTTIALRKLGSKGGLLTNIFGFLIGFTLDMIINSMSGNYAKGGEDDEISTNINPKILKGIPTKLGLSDTVEGIRLIHKYGEIEKISEKKMDEIEKTYLGLMGGMSDEQNSIREASMALDFLSASKAGENLTTFLPPPQFKELQDMVGNSVLFGGEVTDYIKNIPDWFYKADKRQQITYFRNILEIRKYRLKKIKEKLQGYTDSGMAIPDFLNQIKSGFSLSQVEQEVKQKLRIKKGVNDYIRSEGSSSEKHIRSGKDLGVRGSKFDMKKEFMNPFKDRQYKISEFIAFANSLAGSMRIGDYKQKEKLSKIYNDSVSDISTKALTGNQEAYSTISEILKELDMGGETKFKKFLLKSAEQHKQDKDLKDLDWKELEKQTISLTIGEVEGIIKETKKKFIEDNNLESYIEDYERWTNAKEQPKTPIYNPSITGGYYQ